METEDLQYHPQDRHWFGRVNGICSGHLVELTLEVAHDRESVEHKLALVRELVPDVEAVLEQLYRLAYQKYRGTKWERPLADMNRAYFLSSVTLKSDNTTWWLVLEPEFDVESVYNHFLRFTMVGREIVWANFALDAIA